MKHLNESLALQAIKLYSDGLTYEKVSKELEISKGRVGGLIREGIKILENNNENPDDSSVVQVETERVNKPENEAPLIPAHDDNPGLNDAWEKTLLIQATPILRKVVLNSKVFLQHEYFQKHLGYDGDIGDLLVEALNFYWQEMGFSIKITHDSVV